MTVSPLVLASVDSGAVISGCGRYRYRLWRAWGPGPRLPFLMLNPSTADAVNPDPTVTRCIGFARREGFDGIEVVNLFAFRTAYPKEMEAAREPVGPDNDAAIAAVVSAAPFCVAAWGVPKTARLRNMVDARVAGVLATFGRDRWRCLGVSGRHPRHPLMLPSAQALTSWPDAPAKG